MAICRSCRKWSRAKTLARISRNARCQPSFELKAPGGLGESVEKKHPRDITRLYYSPMYRLIRISLLSRLIYKINFLHLSLSLFIDKIIAG